MFIFYNGLNLKTYKFWISRALCLLVYLLCSPGYLIPTYLFVSYLSLNFQQQKIAQIIFTQNNLIKIWHLQNIE